MPAIVALFRRFRRGASSGVSANAITVGTAAVTVGAAVVTVGP